MQAKHLYLAAAALVWCSTSAFAGDLTGTVKFEGTAPNMKKIDMAKEPVCQKEHNPPESIQAVVTGPNNTLDNVLVYVSKGLPAGKTYPAPSQPVTFDQKGCMYGPHVVALQVNQDFKVTNSDPVAHNIHPLAKVNKEWNKSQPPGSGPIDAKFDQPEITIPVKCNIHPWMRGYIAVLDHPFYSVSDANGKFTIKNLPPGHYTITAWQESWGNQTAEVDVPASGNKSVDFTFKAKPVY
jgi:plastocyanin